MKEQAKIVIMNIYNNTMTELCNDVARTASVETYQICYECMILFGEYLEKHLDSIDTKFGVML